MNFNFFMPAKLLFGKGQLNNLHLQKLPGKKALIVISSGKSVKVNGYLDRLEHELNLANVQYAVFDKISPNPTKTQIMEGGAFAKSNNCDFVIGLGGGSSIDASKAIAIMATNPGDYWDYIPAGTGKGLPIQNNPLPIVAITTTAGTGTEADPYTVTTNEDTNEKIGFGYDKTFPVLSIIDPELMLTVPPHFTAYQGFDALFHSMEGYISKNANVVSDLFALKAIELIGKYLPRAVKNGNDVEARENVALGNTLAGIVESTSGNTAEHSLEHALTAHHTELPHGAGLIMLSKAYFTNLARLGIRDDRLIAMAKALGKEDAKTPMDFVDALLDLQKACGVADLKMSDYGIKKEDMPKYAKNALSAMARLFKNEPANLTEADCIAILEAAYR